MLASVVTALSIQVLAQTSASFLRTEDVIYGRKHGMALTMDVFQPAKTNGYGVIFVISGGFFSAKEMVNAGFFQALLDRGYTVFAVLHGSQPKFTIPEATQDLHRALRFIRHRADFYSVRADKLGITGASAGGHLSLTMGTQGGPGKQDAKDPIDRESSAVQAVACFFPPTDFLNYGAPGVDAVGVGILKDFKPAFGPRSDTPESRQEYGREISPANFITTQTAPTLIIHGDADKLVPIQQAQLFVEKAKGMGVTASLVTRPGKQHGWLEIGMDIPLLADWFDKHLRGLPSAAQ
jgi:acetyl esterase/lipase